MIIAWIWYFINKKRILYKSTGKFYTVYVGANRGGVTLGDRIFLSSYYQGEYLALVTAHESGHVKQSMILGPLYLFVIGIPSILWAWCHKTVAPNKSYYWFYPEAWANKLGGVGVNESGVLTWRHLIRRSYGNNKNNKEYYRFSIKRYYNNWKWRLHRVYCRKECFDL